MVELDPDSFFVYATAEGYRPDPDLTVTEWADKNRYLSSVASSEPGKWKTERHRGGGYDVVLLGIT